MNIRNVFILFLSILSLNIYGQLHLKVGRHMFTDTVWVDRVSDVTFRFHTPAYYDGNPVVKADKPWELNVNGDPYAAPFSGGVWYDEADARYKMWYSAGGEKTLGLITCYAESVDGKNWIKPLLDIVPGTNIVDTLEHDCVSVLLDKHEKDESKRFKMFLVEFNSRFTVSMKLKYSADGIHWTAPKALSGELYDRCAAYYDPFRGRYILSLKTIDGEYGRARNFLEHEDPEMLVSLAHRVYDRNSDKFIRYWFRAADDDPRHPLFPDIRPQIYNHEAMPYENFMLGYFTVWQGPENDACDSLKIQKRNEVLVGFSYDGFHWNRQFKKRFLSVSEDFNSWNAGNIQSVAGTPLIVGDSLYFYMSARYNSKPKHDSNFATGLAMLRRDGFVSAESYGKEGYILTKLLSFDGKYFFVNADVRNADSALAIELLDETGKPISGFTKEDCLLIKGINSTKQMVTWKGHKDLSSLEGRAIRVKFYLQQGDLYSFWISPWETGESRGYTAGGGPGLNEGGVDIP